MNGLHTLLGSAAIRNSEPLTDEEILISDACRAIKARRRRIRLTIALAILIAGALIIAAFHSSRGSQSAAP